MLNSFNNVKWHWLKVVIYGNHCKMLMLTLPPPSPFPLSHFPQPPPPPSLSLLKHYHCEYIHPYFQAGRSSSSCTHLIGDMNNFMFLTNLCQNFQEELIHLWLDSRSHLIGLSTPQITIGNNIQTINVRISLSLNFPSYKIVWRLDKVQINPGCQSLWACI